MKLGLGFVGGGFMSRHKEKKLSEKEKILNELHTRMGVISEGFLRETTCRNRIPYVTRQAHEREIDEIPNSQSLFSCGAHPRYPMILS